MFLILFYLDRLSQNESILLINQLLSNASIPEMLKKNIVERSEGNPYFVEEILRMLIDKEILAPVDGDWTVTQEQAVENIPVPASPARR